jgi:hypothetical protein
LCAVAVEQSLGPEVADQGDGGAPGDGDHPAVADRGAPQKPRTVTLSPAGEGRELFSGLSLTIIEHMI